MDALLNVARQVSTLDPNRLLATIQYVATGNSRAPSAWMSLFYDLREFESVFYKLSQAGHDIRAAYRDFNDLRRWVYAAASTMSPLTPHFSHSTRVLPTQYPSQRSPATPSTRPKHMRSRVNRPIPPSPHQLYRSLRGQVVASTPMHASQSSKARFHVRFAPTATIYTYPRYGGATPPPVERPSCAPRAPRAPRRSHAKRSFVPPIMVG